MIEKVLKLGLKYGLHARPSAYIVTRFKELQLDKASVTLEDRTADLRSILNLLALFAEENNELKVVLSGPDEDKALKILEDIFNEKDNAVIYETLPCMGNGK